MEDLGGARVHCRNSGVGDLEVADDPECIPAVKDYLSFFPSNCEQKPPIRDTGDPDDRMSEKLSTSSPSRRATRTTCTTSSARSSTTASTSTSSRSSRRRSSPAWRASAASPSGIVANQPKQLGGILENDSADKAARFVNLCDAFNIPLVFLQDVPGFMVGSKVEHAGIIRHGAKMLYAISRATVPKITVVVRKAYGAGYYVMNGKAYEPDLIVAWPSAEISVMGAEGAVNIIGRSAIEASDDPEATREAMLDAVRKNIDPYIAAKNALIDDIIDPRETRPTIIRGLRMAANTSGWTAAMAKHGVMPGMRSHSKTPRSSAARSAARSPTATSARRSLHAGGIRRRGEARRRRGRSQIHIHARTPDGMPSYEIEDFRAITEAINDEVDDVIINYSTGAIGIPIEKRLEYLRELQPDVAALNMSSMNYAKYSRRRKDFVFKAVFENSFDTIMIPRAMRELGIKPEHECFDAGHIANLDPLLDMGLLEEPVNVSLVIGVNGGIRPNARNVGFMADQIPGGPEGRNHWQVIGISRDQWRLIGAALVLAATSGRASKTTSTCRVARWPAPTAT